MQDYASIYNLIIIIVSLVQIAVMVIAAIVLVANGRRRKKNGLNKPANPRVEQRGSSFYADKTSTATVTHTDTEDGNR